MRIITLLAIVAAAAAHHGLAAPDPAPDAQTRTVIKRIRTLTARTIGTPSPSTPTSTMLSSTSSSSLTPSSSSGSESGTVTRTVTTQPSTQPTSSSFSSSKTTVTTRITICPPAICVAMGCDFGDCAGWCVSIPPNFIFIKIEKKPQGEITDCFHKFACPSQGFRTGPLPGIDTATVTGTVPSLEEYLRAVRDVPAGEPQPEVSTPPAVITKRAGTTLSTLTSSSSRTRGAGFDNPEVCPPGICISFDVSLQKHVYPFRLFARTATCSDLLQEKQFKWMRLTRRGNMKISREKNCSANLATALLGVHIVPRSQFSCICCGRLSTPPRSRRRFLPSRST
ncbi:hypothetical protein QBC43DRAFT_325074 [Cladorrhinum sp. PSN259]|nr:hypothetical protein QBC43DRAFT_325074 [Cladorrhinum sp. PSN259]